MRWDFNDNKLIYNKNINYKELTDSFTNDFNKFIKSPEFKDCETIDLTKIKPSHINPVKLDNQFEQMKAKVLEEMEDISDELDEVPSVIVKKWIKELKNIDRKMNEEIEERLRAFGIIF